MPAASRALCRSWDRVPSQLGVLRNQPLDFKFSQNSRVKSKEQRNAWAALGGRCPLVCNLREISLSPGQAQKNRELPLYLALPIPTLCGCGKGTQVSVSNASSAALLSSMVATSNRCLFKFMFKSGEIILLGARATFQVFNNHIWLLAIISGKDEF